MAYCTLAELVERYGERMLLDLSFRGDAAPEEPDAALFARAIAGADALIDGHLKVRYLLPLSEVPAIVRDLSLTISIYRAHAEVVPDKIRKDYEDALKLCAQISTGAVKLDVAGAEPPGSGGGGARITDRARPMTEDNLKGFV